MRSTAILIKRSKSGMDSASLSFNYNVFVEDQGPMIEFHVHVEKFTNYVFMGISRQMNEPDTRQYFPDILLGFSFTWTPQKPFFPRKRSHSLAMSDHFHSNR